MRACVLVCANVCRVCHAGTPGVHARQTCTGTRARSAASSLRFSSSSSTILGVGLPTALGSQPRAGPLLDRAQAESRCFFLKLELACTRLSTGPGEKGARGSPGGELRGQLRVGHDVEVDTLLAPPVEQQVTAAAPAPPPRAFFG